MAMTYAKWWKALEGWFGMVVVNRDKIEFDGHVIPINGSNAYIELRIEIL